MKRNICGFLIICLCLMTAAGCGKTADSSETTQTASLTTQSENIVQNQIPTQETSTGEYEASTQEETLTEVISDMATIAPPATPPTAQTEPETEEVSQAPSTTKVIEKTGEMAFSDDASNRYIEAISQKYSVDTATLVALYTVPENDSNIVLEFDGTKNSDGTLVRNKDTLIAIYSIDRQLNSKRASEDRNLNEYSYGEMKVMFFTTTNHIMPEFEELK